MFCKMCGKEVENKFYCHLNTVHRIKNGDYFDKFPEQLEEYNKQKKPQWCKGQTKETNQKIRDISEAIKKYQSNPEVRLAYSKRVNYPRP